MSTFDDIESFAVLLPKLAPMVPDIKTAVAEFEQIATDPAALAAVAEAQKVLSDPNLKKAVETVLRLADVLKSAQSAVATDTAAAQDQ